MAYLIDEHGLSLTDLPEIITPEVIEFLLNQDQVFTFSQIQQLYKRFNIQPQIFFV